MKLIGSYEIKLDKNLIWEALNDPESEVRASASTMIGSINKQGWSIDLLIKRLNDNDYEVRQKAALSLMKLKAIKSIKHLKKRSEIEKNSKVLNILTLSINQLEQENKIANN